MYILLVSQFQWLRKSISPSFCAWSLYSLCEQLGKQIAYINMLVRAKFLEKDLQSIYHMNPRVSLIFSCIILFLVAHKIEYHLSSFMPLQMRYCKYMLLSSQDWGMVKKKISSKIMGFFLVVFCFVSFCFCSAMLRHLG